MWFIVLYRYMLIKGGDLIIYLRKREHDALWYLKNEIVLLKNFLTNCSLCFLCLLLIVKLILFKISFQEWFPYSTYLHRNGAIGCCWIFRIVCYWCIMCITKERKFGWSYFAQVMAIFGFSIFRILTIQFFILDIFFM